MKKWKIAVVAATGILATWLQSQITEPILPPRAYGQKGSLVLTFDIIDATQSTVVSDGMYFPKGRWCRTSPTCQSCRSYRSCPSCPLCKARYAQPQCRTSCDEKKAGVPTLSIYTFILALSTAYLLVQLKMIVVLWIPSFLDIMRKSKVLYDHDVLLLREKVETLACSDKEMEALKGECSKHEHILFKMLPSNISKHIGEYLTGMDFCMMQQVCCVWMKVGKCKYSWYKLYMNAYGQESTKKKIFVEKTRNFYAEYAKRIEYRRAQKYVEAYERKCLNREDHQSEQIDQLRTLVHLRNFATYASLMTALWQCIDMVVSIIQWSTCVCAATMMLYFGITTMTGHSHNQSQQKRLLNIFAASVGVGALINLMFFSSLGINTGPSVGTSLDAIQFVLSFVRIVPPVALGLSLIHTLNSFASKKALVISSAAFVVVLEFIYYYFGITTPLLTGILVSLVPVTVFCMRFIPWGYCIGTAFISYFDDFSRLRWFKSMVVPYLSVISVEYVLHHMGYPNTLLLWLMQSGGEIICHLARLISTTTLCAKIVLYVCWIFVPQQRCRSILIANEKKNLKVAFTKFFFVEITFELFNVSTPLLLELPHAIRNVLAYAYWSRSVSLLAFANIFYCNRLPRVTCESSTLNRIHMVTLVSVAIMLVFHDIYYDIYDIHPASQMKTSTAWLLIWVLY